MTLESALDAAIDLQEARRPAQPPARPVPIVSPRPGIPAPVQQIALPRWAAALVEGRKHPVPRIKRRADRLYEQLEELAVALDDAQEEQKTRERIAELEAERDRLRASLGHKKPGPKSTKPINHGSAGGARAHKIRGEEPCQPCSDAMDEFMQSLRARRVNR